MQKKLPTSFLPLSITAYGVLFILAALLLFGGFTWLAVGEINALQTQTRERNQALAIAEVSETVSHVLEESERLAKQFAAWNETIQQLSNSTYYAYWREYRAPASGFFGDFLAGIEIYNRKGNALAKPLDPDMPDKINVPVFRARLIKQNGRDNLYYSFPVVYDGNSRDVVGYVLIKVDLRKAMAEMQRFKYADPRSISIDVSEDEGIGQAEIAQHISVAEAPDIGFNQLQDLMFSTLNRFIIIGLSLGLLLLFLLIRVFGLPSRRLSHQIDALRLGDRTSLHDTGNDTLAVAEFEKVRRSLNDYQAQLDNRDAALRENEMRMRAVLDNVVDGIVTIDERGVIESCNPAVKRIFAVREQDLIGLKITALLPESARAAYDDYVRAVSEITAEDSYTHDPCELVGKRGDQSEFPLEIALSRMHVGQRRLYIAVLRDITERKRAQARLVYLANFDELTGLPNRTLFRDRLRQAVVRAKREEHLVALVFFDLDQFKKINDTLGHHAGDQLLLGASKRLQETIRELDTVARLGGDEFMVILEGIRHVDEVTNIVTKMLTALERPFMIEGQEAFVGASAGIAIYPFDDSDIDNLVKNADVAMFRAKEHGGNSYQYYEAQMNSKALERLKIEGALRYALERNEFELHYQPRVDLITGAVSGMEALLRWNSPQVGAITPLQFVPLLEETGLIVPVGDWVLRTACEQTRRWHDAGHALTVSVNLSVRQFRQNDLVKRFLDIIQESRINPRQLELEITEGLLVESMDAAIRMLGELNNRGVQISVDDFGTGYSSLSYLKRLPINTIKIDRSFVRDISDDPNDAAITAAIVALARSLRMKVTAEGIETKEQLDFIKSLHCDEAQGFYFARPLTARDFEQFIAQPGMAFHEARVSRDSLSS